MPAKGYKKTSPCPACGGYGGAYKKENRCRGFISASGTTWCENSLSPTKKDLGYCLVYLVEEAKLSSNRETPTPSLSLLINSESPKTIPEEREDSQTLNIQVETREYPERGRWQPAETKVWYVLYAGSKELARSLNRSVVERYKEVRENAGQPR